jgi:hypothetical protein
VWRAGDSRPQPPGELERARRVLLESGCGPVLAWAAARRGRADSQCSAARRSAALRNAVAEQDLESLAQAFDAAGLRWLLVKGWAVAREYPEADLRPYGDIDVVVGEQEYGRAREVTRRLAPHLATAVDLHRGLGGLLDRSFDDVMARSALARLGGSQIRIPCAEDHARLVASHLLRHGAVRPLWLLDLAVLVEVRNEGFEWERLLTRGRSITRWIEAALLLARSLLGLDLTATPLARAPAPPAWLLREVIGRWSRPPALGEHQHPLAGFTSARRVCREWRERTPSPIQASLRFGVPPNRWPRWPLQLLEFLARLPAKPALIAEAIRARRIRRALLAPQRA